MSPTRTFTHAIRGLISIALNANHRKDGHSRAFATRYRGSAIATDPSLEREPDYQSHVVSPPTQRAGRIPDLVDRFL
jgi:hypothetical protein